MYKTYLWKVKPTSSYITPWQSDTIYGHLLWAVLFLYGEEELNEIIGSFKSYKPPFICSNGFVNDEFPLIKKSLILREDVKKISQDIYGDNNPRELIKTIRGIKESNKRKTIGFNEFEKLREGSTNEELLKSLLKERRIEKKGVFSEIPIMHNVVNRLSGVTEENGIYTLNEKFLDGEISIFIKVREDFPLEKLDSLLKYIEINGFGKKVSSGKGQVERVEFREFNEFKNVENANGFVVLSNFIPKFGDYNEVVTGNIITKRGKTSNDIDTPEFPFKKPFVCYTPGSLFKKGDNKIVGNVLRNIHIDSRIIQIGIPFVVEVKI